MAFEWYVLFILGNFVRNHSNKEKKEILHTGYTGGETLLKIFVLNKSLQYTLLPNEEGGTRLLDI